MKKILVLHPALEAGNTEDTLIHYLNLLAQNENFQIDLFLSENLANHNIHLISPKINIEHALTPLETAYLLYLCEILQHKAFDYKPEEYYVSWLNGIKNAIRKKIQQKINQQYNVIIDFQRNYRTLDNYFTPYNFPDNAKVIRFVHNQYEIDAFYDSNPDHSRLLLPKFTKICLNNDELRQSMAHCLSRHHIPCDNLDFIFNPIDQNAIVHQMNLRLSDEDENRLNNDYLLHICHSTKKQESQLALLEIYAKLKQQGIPQKLYIIGANETETAFTQHIQQWGLEKDCVLLGKPENPYPYMKNATLLLDCTPHEDFPTTLLKSMICGTPAVSFDYSTGTNDILAGGKYGECIPVTNGVNEQALFIEKTLALLQNEDKLKTYEALLPEAVARFNAENVAEKLFAMIDEITSETN